MSIFSTVPSRRFLFCFVHNNLTVSQIFSFVRKILPGTSGPKWKIYLCLSIPHYVLYAVHLHEYQRGSRGVFGPLRNCMTHLLFLRKWNYWDKCLMCFHLLYSSHYSKYALAKKSLKQKSAQVKRQQFSELSRMNHNSVHTIQIKNRTLPASQMSFLLFLKCN